MSARRSNPATSEGRIPTTMPPTSGSAPVGAATGTVERLVEAHQRGLKGLHRHDGQYALGHLQMIGGVLRDRIDMVDQLARRRRRNRDVPVHDFSVTRREADLLGERLVEAINFPGDGHFEWALGGVANRELRRERITEANNWRNPGQDHQILRRFDGRRAGPEQARLGARDRDDAEAGQRIIERHLDRGIAVRIERRRSPSISSSVSKSLRVICRPPPPPGGIAFNP